MNRRTCDNTGVAVFDFLEGGEGTVEDHLTSNELYPSSTYFYLCKQPRHLSNDEIEGSQDIKPMKSGSAPTAWLVPQHQLQHIPQKMLAKKCAKYVAVSLRRE